jgi:hypothetical protein
MARKRLYEYSFTPGTGGLGTVKVPDRYNLADILAMIPLPTLLSITLLILPLAAPCLLPQVFRQLSPQPMLG